MLGRFGSFILGVAIAVVILGVFMLLLSAINGDDSPTARRRASNTPSTGESTPEVAVTAVLSAAPSATPPPPAATEDPSPPPPEAEVATATPESTDCCQEPPPPPTDVAISPGRAPPVAPPPPAATRPTQTQPPLTRQSSDPPQPSQPPPIQPPPIQPPPIQPPPVQPPPPAPVAPAPNPGVQSFADLLASVTRDASSLAARVAAPDFANASWGETTIALAKRVELAGGMVSVMSPPACLAGAHASLRSATIELSRASGLIVSAVGLRDSRLLASGAERLAAGRAGLPIVQSQLAAAAC